MWYPFPFSRCLRSLSRGCSANYPYTPHTHTKYKLAYYARSCTYTIANSYCRERCHLLLLLPRLVSWQALLVVAFLPLTGITSALYVLVQIPIFGWTLARCVYHNEHDLMLQSHWLCVWTRYMQQQTIAIAINMGTNNNERHSWAYGNFSSLPHCYTASSEFTSYNRSFLVSVLSLQKCIEFVA